MQPIPRTRRTPQNTQHTYSLGRKVHDVKTYPVQSPQGATILIYGHENGITVTWRGGRRLKEPSPTTKNDKQNGSSTSDAVMIIDSDDEASAATPAAFHDKPQFQEASNADSTSPPEIAQTLDLAFGTAVLGVAVLPMPNLAPEDAAWNGATILQEKMVFAVTCASTEVYVVTLPLTPPSHESKARLELRKNLLAGNAGKGMWGETLTRLGGQSRLCDGVAITLFKSKASPRSRSVERTAAHSNQSTRAIVAAHSREASGTLRFWDVSLDGKPGVTNSVVPFQTEYLPAPLTAISFNPTHVTQLLAVASSQAIRIYDYSIASLPSEDTSEGPFPAQGSWLLSLYPPFARGTSVSTARKPIVAAEWISHGRAVLTLLADGQWGIWDIDGVSPSANGASSTGLFSKASTGLRGSAVTNFSVTGHLEGTSPLRNPGTQKAATASTSGEFVPMTPHTRRDAIASVISGGLDKLVTVKGGIAIARFAPSRAADIGEESAVLWLGGVDPIVCVIPTVSKFWDSQIRRAGGGGVNLWSGAQPTRMVRITDLVAGLLGERCTGAAAVPTASRIGAASTTENGSSQAESLPIEVLLQGESRIVVVHESEEAASFTTRLLAGRKKARLDLDSTKAILAYPRPEKPNSVAFNLSLAHRPGKGGAGLLRSRRAPVAGGLFDQPVDSYASTEVPDQGSFSQGSFSQAQSLGLGFINDLNYAADQPDDKVEANERDIEVEMMDLMDLDEELKRMESARERSTKRVFFEEG
ncbi:nucleoporin NUP37 [Podospora australis]|uniref:Nucleoporin NUP37 n=1 Tax=Podospora australis TaxID=1536484 RepID=A0AAN6WRP9_9PEZI|nr:nucleoporin NUP37 [Podospora australis]